MQRQLMANKAAKAVLFLAGSVQGALEDDCCRWLLPLNIDFAK